MTEDNVFLKAMRISLEYSRTQGALQKGHFESLFANERVRAVLKQNLNVDVVIQEQTILLKTFLGDICIEFAHGLDGQYVCPVAVFGDVDEQGKRRDLYAVRLNVEQSTWVDSFGSAVQLDLETGLTSPTALFDFVRKAMATKLHLSEERIGKIGK